MDDYILFNNKLIDFIEDLQGIIGHMPEYKILLTSAKFLAQVKEKQNQKLFHDVVVVPYGRSILTRDEAFLLDEKYSENKADVVDMLKHQWSTMQAQDKESVWAHMTVLVTLSERCHNRKKAKKLQKQQKLVADGQV